MVIAAARAKPIIERKIGLTQDSMPAPTPNRLSHGAAVGPSTAPMVPIQTTIAIAPARPSSVARSAAANRLCRFDALAMPNTTIATTRSQNC